MNQKKKISIILAVIVIMAITATGFLFFKGDGNDTNESSSPGVSETQDSKNNEATEDAEKSKLPTEEIQKEIDETRKFEDATEVANFSKEQVQEVLRTATEFTYNGMTNSYFLSGQWVEDGMPNVIEPVVGQYFIQDIRNNIKTFDTNPETGKNIDVQVFPMMMYIFPNEIVGTSETCKVDDNGNRPGCLISGPEFTDMTYVPTMSGEVAGINVKYSATIRVPVTLNGEEAFVDIRNDYDLNFVQNENFDAELNPQTFVINYYKVQTNLGAVTAL